MLKWSQSGKSLIPKKLAEHVLQKRLMGKLPGLSRNERQRAIGMLTAVCLQRDVAAGLKKYRMDYLGATVPPIVNI